MCRSAVAVLLTCAVTFGMVAAALNLADDVECGTAPQGSRRKYLRVVGGSLADIADFPYTISLKKKGKHHCGGSLLNKYYVLTAAHCVKGGWAIDIWTITVGTNLLDVPQSYNQTFKIEDIVIHPDFEWSENDIAIIKLDRPVEWSDLVQPICLPDPGAENFAGKHGLLAGWGYEKDGETSLPDQLHFVEMPIMGNVECQELYNKYNEENKKSIKIIDEQVCAGYEEGKIDGCNGDSGSALVSEVDQKQVIVGLMSGVAEGAGCGRPNTPGIYTNVLRFVDWIKNTTENWNNPNNRRHHLHWTGVDIAGLRLKREEGEALPLGRLPGLFAHRQSALQLLL